ncbi:MAG: helix-turn-helix domain-containing protein [Clostridia bacterium]|nr:helix-turn-helix domain-containing protein [Clostridia bacterium]
MFNRIPQPEQTQPTQQAAVRAYPKMTLTVEELADELNISAPTAYKLVKEKDFPAFNIGNRILVNREGLQRWLDHQPPITAA